MTVDQIENLAEKLVAAGVKFAFGVTGSGSSLQLISRLEEKGVRYTPTCDESAAALMAGAVSRHTGKPAVSISIKGPGLANMLPGIAANAFENAGAISISEAFGDDAPISAQHKRLDHKALLKTLVKGRMPLNQLESTFSFLMDLRQAEIPGPVHIDLCSESAESSEPSPFPSVPDNPQAFASIEASQKPIVVVGSLGLRRAWGKRLAKFEVPFLWTAAAKGVVYESHPYAAGIFTGTGRELAPETHILKDADLIIGLGFRNTELIKAVPFPKSLVLLDEVAGFVQEGLSAQEFSCFESQKNQDTFFSIMEHKRWGADLVQKLLRDMKRALLAEPWFPARCFEWLNDLKFDYGLVMDTGSFCTIGEHVWLTGPGRSFLGTSNGRFMGTSIPTAIGLAMATQDPVFCVLGDGGIRIHAAEIKTAVQEKLPICFVLMKDGFFGSVAAGTQPGKSSLKAVTVPQPSWHKAVAGMGCTSFEVRSDAEFEKIVGSWKRSEPLFIEASFDPTAYRSMTERLRA